MTFQHLATRLAVIVTGVALLVPTRATGQTFIPDDQVIRVGSIDGLGSAVKTGDRVSVLQTNGVTIFGKVEKVSASGLTLVAEGLRFQLDVATIRQVERWHRQTVRGLWIGALVGAGLGFAIGSGGSDSGENYAGPVAFISAVYGAGVGALIGTFDQSGHEVVYTAPASKSGLVVTPHGAGIRVAFRF